MTGQRQPIGSDRRERARDYLVCAVGYRHSDPDRARMYREAARALLTPDEWDRAPDLVETLFNRAVWLCDGGMGCVCGGTDCDRKDDAP